MTLSRLNGQSLLLRIGSHKEWASQQATQAESPRSLRWLQFRVRLAVIDYTKVKRIAFSTLLILKRVDIFCSISEWEQRAHPSDTEQP